MAVQEQAPALANPGPLGLVGFGLTTVLLSLINAGLLPAGFAPQVGQRLQHADLVGGAGAAAGEQQPRGRSGAGRVGGACGGGRQRHGGSP